MPSRGMTMLLALLALYVTIVVLTAAHAFEGDEAGYLAYATRIAGGPPAPVQDFRFWWGPGYPLVLAPFVLLGIPLLWAKSLNALFLFGAIVYFNALLQRYFSRTAAVFVALCLGLYPPIMRSLPYLGAECLTLFLMCGFMFHFCSLYNPARRYRAHLVAASSYLAYLALTKIFFGYVIASVIALSLGMHLWRSTQATRTALRVASFAMVCCIPYLMYMYSVTGRAFYWATSGGMSLYWMSTPHAAESGTWFSNKDVMEKPELAKHRDFFASLNGLSDVERDEAFKVQAIQNITHHPAKYLYNWAANVGRLLFSYPFDLGVHNVKTYFYLAPNMFIVVLFVLSLIPAALRPSEMPFELRALLVFAFVALAGTTLLSAYDRQFRPLVPVLDLWMAFVYLRVLRIQMRYGTGVSEVGQL